MTENIKINVTKKLIVKPENLFTLCIEHGYVFPCPVCDGESDS
jgi:hypothetical protein